MVEYSSGTTKKIGLACALTHAPRLLILDEPFETVDPVSGEGIRAILRNYARGGGTVVLSSHVMELVESLCDELAVVADGRVLASGTVETVRAGSTLQQRSLDLVGFTAAGEGTLSWLRSSSDWSSPCSATACGAVSGARSVWSCVRPTAPGVVLAVLAALVAVLRRVWGHFLAARLFELTEPGGAAHRIRSGTVVDRLYPASPAGESQPGPCATGGPTPAISPGSPAS